MPLFLDRHDVSDVTPEAVAAAHLSDLEIQGIHGVSYRSYWFDPAEHSIFCLVEGPDRAAVETVHREAHGMMADQLVQLPDGAPLSSFFGLIPDHPAGTPYTEPAVRTIVFTDICGSVAHTHSLGDEGHAHQLDIHDEVVTKALSTCGGRQVKHTGDGVMASFSSAVSAVEFASIAQREVTERGAALEHSFEVTVGITAGEPLTRGSDDLFGTTVQIAARLCAAAAPGEILVSSVIRELCRGKTHRFDDRGEVELKGVPETTRVFAVQWRD